MSSKISAVADEDVKKLLTSLNLLQEVEDRKLHCIICGDLINLENIGCIYPHERIIKICCDNLYCIKKVIDEITPLRHLTRDEGKLDET